MMLKMVALDLDSVVVVLGSVWAAVLLSVLLPALPIPCANEGMLRVSARGEAARVRTREPGGGQRSEARRRARRGWGRGGEDAGRASEGASGRAARGHQGPRAVLQTPGTRSVQARWRRRAADSAVESAWRGGGREEDGGEGEGRSGGGGQLPMKRPRRRGGGRAV